MFTRHPSRRDSSCKPLGRSFRNKSSKEWPFHIHNPKGPLQEGRQTELRGHSLEVFQMDYKYNRVSEWQRRCESSEKSNVGWHYSWSPPRAWSVHCFAIPSIHDF